MLLGLAMMLLRLHPIVDETTLHVAHEMSLINALMKKTFGALCKKFERCIRKCQELSGGCTAIRISTADEGKNSAAD